jgi:hypothetical protein
MIRANMNLIGFYFYFFAQAPEPPTLRGMLVEAGK